MVTFTNSDREFRMPVDWRPKCLASNPQSIDDFLQVFVDHLHDWVLNIADDGWKIALWFAIVITLLFDRDWPTGELPSFFGSNIPISRPAFERDRTV